MTKDFFWAHVSRPAAVGTGRDKAKQDVPMSANHEAVFNSLSQTDENQGFSEDFDVPSDIDDDDLASDHSSCMGSVASEEGSVTEMEDEDGPADPDDWTELNEKERSSRISEALKKLSNVKRKAMSKDILNDMLGKDGANALKKIRKNEEKVLRAKKRKVNLVFMAVQHFESKMNKRRKLLIQSMERSTLGTYFRCEADWKRKYDASMPRKRTS